MKQTYLVAGGSLSLAVNRQNWPTQAGLEEKLVAAVERLGRPVRRAHPFEPAKGHGLIDGLPLSLEIFRGIPADAPLLVTGAGASDNRHLLPGLSVHAGPILTVGNWSGGGEGIAGFLDLNGGLAALGIKHSTLWSETFADELFTAGLRRWLEKGKIRHDETHVRPFDLKPRDAPADLGDAMRTGRDFARRLRRQRVAFVVINEGCPGLDPVPVPDALLRGAGVGKVRLGEGELTRKLAAVREEEAQAAFDWCLQSALRFRFGPNEATALTEAEVLAQCRLYVAAVRLADEHGGAASGLPPGLEATGQVVTSALTEGMLNSIERPPVHHADTGDELFPGQALPSFHAGDEGAGLDGLVTCRLWRELGYAPETAAYGLRWGRDYRDETTDAYVWTLLGHGSTPPAHFGGWERASSERTAADAPVGGGTLKGVCRPGWIVWSQVSVDGERRLGCDTGIAEVVSLPVTETEDRWQRTTPSSPILHAVLQGITRDQMLGRLKGGSLQVVYAPDKEGARRGLFAKAAALRELGVEVAVCGNISGER